MRPSPVVPDVRRIAVLRAVGIGDLVLALPALDALHAAYPDAELVLLARAPHRELLRGRPGPVDRVEVVPPYPGVGDDTASRDSPEVRAWFAAQPVPDLAEQLHGGGGNSNPFVRRLGARVSVGARAAGAPGLDRDMAYGTDQHEVLRLLEVVALAGASPVGLAPRLLPAPGDAAAARAVLPDDGRPLVVLHPGATDPLRRWPVERFAAVADALAGRGCTVAVVGSGPDDAATAARLCALALTAPVDLVDRLPLPATAGLLARADLLVGNDSGPRHLAEALGTPTVGVFWLPNLLNAGPLTRARHRVAVSRRTTWPAGEATVADVPLAEVLAACDDLLARTLAA